MRRIAPLPDPEIGACDALIVVPPFCEPHYPSLGVHTIQACARARSLSHITPPPTSPQTASNLPRSQ
jgi:hypothetical protein